MRIGIDVATLALKRIVDRIILISGDIDMLPAMKLARREGIQVVMVEVGCKLSSQLDEDCDLVREITPQSSWPPESPNGAARAKNPAPEKKSS